MKPINEYIKNAIEYTNQILAPFNLTGDRYLYIFLIYLHEAVQLEHTNIITINAHECGTKNDFLKLIQDARDNFDDTLYDNDKQMVREFILSIKNVPSFIKLTQY